MWDCLVKISTWAESNSGQIQIVLGVLGFLIARKALLAALDQTKIGITSIEKAQEQLDQSLKQTELANQNRFIDNKNQILILLMDTIEKASETVSQIENIDTNLLMTRIEKYRNEYEVYKKISNDFLKSQEDLKGTIKLFGDICTLCKSDYETVTKIEYKNADDLDHWLERVLTKKMLVINAIEIMRKKERDLLLLANPI